MGTGAGIVLPFNQNIALSAIPESESGEASGMFYTMTDFAAAITTALLGMLAPSEHTYFVGLAILIVIVVVSLVPRTKKE